MAEKIKLYDDSKCTACRGCQLACKQWNQMPARQTRNNGEEIAKPIGSFSE